MNSPLNLTLYLLIFLMAFNFTSPLMGGGFIVSDLGGSSEISMYGIAFFGLGNAASLAFAYELGRRFGRIQVLLVATLAFFISMFFCGYSPTFVFLVIMRFFAGAASGIFLPLCISLINESIPPEKSDRAMAVLAVIFSVAPVIGACFGAWIAYEYKWPWIFYLQLPFILLSFFVLCFYKTPHAIPENKNFDWTGYLFYLLMASSFVTAIALGQELDWFRSPLICILLTISCISTPFFILWEWNHENPFMDLKLFKIPVFFLSIFSVSFLFSAYFGMIILLALWLRMDANYTPLWIALIVSHMLIAGLILFVALERCLEKTASFWVVSIAVVFFAISCFYSTTFNAEIDFGRLAVARIFAGFGLAFFLFPLLLLCLHSLPKEKIPQGIGLFQSVRLLSGSLGIVGYATIWFRRKIFYHERLGEQLTSYSELTTQFFSDVSLYGFSGMQSDALLERALEKQSSALALADCFYLMGWIMIGILVMIFFHLFYGKSPFKKKLT